MSTVIQIENLHKYYGQSHILKGINLNVDGGQIIGYIGPNGAGKSTTVKILCGLDGEFHGEIKVNGLDIRKNPIEIKKTIGYIPEVSEIYDVLTPMEYLKLIGKLQGLNEKIIKSRSEHLLEIFDLKNNLNDRMDSFSKGMRQKVLIISGLIHDPQIIFMDEPMAGLDANSVIMVKEIISILAEQGKTIFYCSHIMDVVEKISNRIILIVKGEVIADGSYQELKSKHSGSLESIFAKITGDTDHRNRALDFIKAMKDYE